MPSYNHALEIVGCESIYTTVRTRILLLWAGTLIRMLSWRWLPKNESYSETLRVQSGEDGVGRQNRGPIATERRPGVWYSGVSESDGVGDREDVG